MGLLYLYITLTPLFQWNITHIYRFGPVHIYPLREYNGMINRNMIIIQ